MYKVLIASCSELVSLMACDKVVKSSSICMESCRSMMYPEWSHNSLKWVKLFVGEFSCFVYGMLFVMLVYDYFQALWRQTLLSQDY